MGGSRSRSLLRRYAPFLGVVAAQALLVALVPSTGDGRDEITALAGSGPGALGPATGGAVDPATGAPVTVPGGAPAPGGAAAPGGGGTGPAAPGAPAGGGGPAGPAAAGGPGGDTSHCTEDGRQQGVTLFSPPCVPVFTGDNGGNTYAGVSGDTINAVLVRNTFGPYVDASLRAVGLAASPEDEEATMRDFAKFFEKRYEQYGRTINWSYYYAACDMSQSVDCAREQAKTIVAKFDPFIVVTPLAVLPEYFDQLSREGVVNLGGWHFTREFMQRLRPYHYDWMPDGTRIARNLASYWCSKLAGKNATLAGDPTLQAKPRKLAIIAPSTEQGTLQAKQVQQFIAEGCGNKSARPQLYQYSGDFSKSSEEFRTVVTALRADAVTTVVCLCDPIRPSFMTTAADQQAYFPEHLLSGMGASDHDYFGRLYSPTQWRNAFGPAIQPALVAKEKQDDYKAYQDVGAQYRCYACLANFIWMHLAAIQIQWAGPNLTPATVEQGTLNATPIGGFEATGDPLVQLVKFGPGEYTAVADSRNVYYDPNAPSPIDGRPGAYVCVDPGCRRFEVGRWPGGDPRRPS